MSPFSLKIGVDTTKTQWAWGPGKRAAAWTQFFEKHSPQSAV